MRPIAVTILALATATAGCAAVPPPAELDPGQGSVFDYLAARYDHDGDRRITAGEYDRDGGDFDRLDRDGNGFVTVADFAPRGPAGAPRMAQMVAQMTILRHLQGDDDPRSLTRDELAGAAALADRDGDGRLDREEVEGRPVPPGAPPMPPGMDTWGDLLLAVDGDGDGALTSAELLSFFDARDDGDGRWLPPGAPKPGEASPKPRPPSGPAEDTVAPDFTLRSPDGARSFTLSDFRGDRPVALIFGSWT